MKKFYVKKEKKLKNNQTQSHTKTFLGFSEFPEKGGSGFFNSNTRYGSKSSQNKIDRSPFPSSTKVETGSLPVNPKLLQGFLQAKSHYGASIKVTKPHNRKYLYGIRSKQTILNLQYTIHSLKRAFLLIGKILQTPPKYYRAPQSKILIICNNQQTQFLGHQLVHPRIQVLQETWIGGFLTNPILLKDKLKNVELIIALNIIRDDLLINAAKKSNIPLIAVTNTNFASQTIDYPIFINTKNAKSIFFFLFLFKKYLIL